MRIAYPTVTSMGFGNNAITLAKAKLIADSCGLRYQRPRWPPTEHVRGTVKGYGHYFPSTPKERLRIATASYLLRLQRILRTRLWPPVVVFERGDYEATRVPDAGEACLAHLAKLRLNNPKRALIVTTSGMWGGYIAIERARPWLRELLQSHEPTRKRLSELEQSMSSRPRIGVNVRMADFLPPSAANADRQGERVVRLPLEWYSRICREARSLCDCQIVLVTDGTREELRPFLQEFHPVHTIGEPDAAMLGVLLLAGCDLLVCSNSTYSRLACFLNDRPYIWFADTLIQDHSSEYGWLWNHDASPMPSWLTPQPPPSGCSDPNAVRRCVALPSDFRAFPSGLSRYLRSGAKAAIDVQDDLLYGHAVYLA